VAVLFSLSIEMKLFVAKLNRDAVESDLLEWFSAMGPVRSAKVVVDRDTGQSKCFGFVEMDSKEGGEKAIAEMNGQEFMGFRMVVKEAEERGARPSSGRPSGARPGDARSASSGTDAPRSGSGTAPSFGENSGGSGLNSEKKATPKKKSSRQKPDKYSDGPRQTKMKKTRGGGGAKGWSNYDDDF
jgi:RNA recognition motif-containing protein